MAGLPSFITLRMRVVLALSARVFVFVHVDVLADLAGLAWIEMIFQFITLPPLLFYFFINAGLKLKPVIAFFGLFCWFKRPVFHPAGRLSGPFYNFFVKIWHPGVSGNHNRFRCLNLCDLV